MDDELEDSVDNNEAGASKGQLSDTIRRALFGGLSALTTTEEGIRSAVGEMRLPKEIAQIFLHQAEKSRKEIFRLASEEIKTAVSGIDITNEIRKALHGMELDVRATISFKQTGEVKSDVKIKKKTSTQGTKKTKSTTTTTTPKTKA